MKFHTAMTVAASIVLISCSLLILFKQVDFLFEHKKIFTDIKYERLFWALFCLFFASCALLSLIFNWPTLNPKW
jgi:hypothetical protein